MLFTVTFFNLVPSCRRSQTRRCSHVAVTVGDRDRQQLWKWQSGLSVHAWGLTGKRLSRYKKKRKSRQYDEFRGGKNHILPIVVSSQVGYLPRHIMNLEGKKSHTADCSEFSSWIFCHRYPTSELTTDNLSSVQFFHGHKYFLVTKKKKSFQNSNHK